MLVDDVLTFLYTHADKSYANFTTKLLPSTIDKTLILGVRLPILRQLAQQLIKENTWSDYLTQNNNKYFEQTMLEGFIIAYAPIELCEKFKLMHSFLPKINNWSVCDSFCASFKLKSSNKNQYLPFITTYLHSNNEYELRFAIVMLLDYYLTEDFAENALCLIYQTKDISYSVKMAKAWAFSKYFTYYPEKGLIFLQKQSLNRDVFKMTCQKIRDSKRVNSNYKKQLKNL